ncbi:hypothetical protein AWC38_SpisGene21795 [Stylophora pistillata]|uniref:Uncharacterized protein n=1 Tax=Stylophora pistillata TaxID=50429 RepID=A0A2B4R8W2_STYPI|nr:hypothetical protein AWC38_SpisGene21795 [Stylophora pistillata]
MLELHQHRNVLQQQQKKVMEMLVTQQRKSSLPHPKVPMFDGEPMGYSLFITAFENIIESKTSSSSERLYYLEQFTSADVKELFKSIQYLSPDNGNLKARRLKKKFGDHFRIVAAYENIALSWPELMKGPDLTNSPLGVLIRFRQRIAFMADIEAMFHQVKVPDCDRSFLRFLWWPDGDLSRALAEYQMIVHLFGAVSSPVCAKFALRKTADYNEQHFSCNVINTVRRNFYVNDCLKFLPSVTVAIAHVYELCSLLPRGFRLKKWVGSSRDVLESIPMQERGQEIKKLELRKDELLNERALGFQWRIENGTFGCNVNLEHKPPTRRGIFSIVSSVFDPFGFLGPFVLIGKEILQDLCRIKLGWDDKVPTEYREQWQRWLSDVLKLSHFVIVASNQPTLRRLCPVRFTPSPTPPKLAADQCHIYDWSHLSKSRFLA